MIELASKIPLCLVVAGLLGLYIGYLLGKEACKNIEEIKESEH